jgi:signal transduction histidine kinase
MTFRNYTLYVLLLCFFIALSGTSSANSLHNALLKAEKDTTRLRLCLLLAWELQQDNPDSALFYLTQAGKISAKIPADSVMKNLKAQVFQELGLTYSSINNYTSSDSCFELAIALNKQLGDKVSLLDNLNGIAINNYQNGKYEKAMERLIEALPLAQELGNKKSEAGILKRIGTVFIDLGNYDKAIEYLLNALKIAEGIDDKLEMSRCYTNLGIVHYERSQTDRKNDEKNMLDIALSYHFKSFAINKELGLKSELARNYTNISNVYSLQGLVQKSLEYNQQALVLYEEMGNKYRLVIGYANMAGANITLADSIHNNRPQQIAYLNKALEYENKAYALAKEIDDLFTTTGITESMKNIYKRLGKYDDALEYAELFIQLKDSLLNEEKIKATTEMSTKYETEQKEQQLKMQQVQMQNERMLRYILIFGLLALAVLAVYIFVNYKNKQQANRLLQKQKDEILSQSEQLEQQNKKLNELMQFKQGLTSMIVHDLKNPLNTIINSSGLTADERKLAIIHQSGHQMLNQVLNILDVDKYENARFVIDPQPISLLGCSSAAIQQVSLLIQQKNISVQNSISEAVTVNAENDIVERIFINLLTNAIKYTPNNGNITLSAQRIESAEKLIKVLVTDTGTGIAPEEAPLVFEKFKQLNARNSGNVRSTGLGLTYCKMAVEAHGGTIWTESKQGEGATFGFTLPVSAIGELTGKKGQATNSIAKQPLELTNSEVQYLASFANQFEKLHFYEASAISSVLETIDPNVGAGVKQWKLKMEDAVYVCNEQQYAELTQLIHPTNG